MTPELLKAIERVKALRSLAGNNPSEHEVKAATRAADKIMQEYRISQAMLEATGKVKTEPFATKIAHSAGKRALYKEVILGSACSRYGCVYYTSRCVVFNEIEGKDERQMSYIVVGRESDVEIVNYLFDYLVGEGLRLTAILNKGKGTGYGKSWLEGFGVGAAEQINKAKEEEKALALTSTYQSTALVFLDKRVKEAQAHLKSTVRLTSIGGVRGANARPDAKSEGYRVGKAVPINKGLNK